MRYTHAIVSRIGDAITLNTSSGNTYSGGVELNRARKDQEALCDALRDAGVSIIELSPEETCPASNLFVEDSAIVVNGTALITNPIAPSRRREISSLLRDMGLFVFEMDMSDKKKLLNCSDVLFTGREFFVAMTKWTNEDGASELARTFPEYPTIPISIGTGQKHLKHYVSMATNDVLAIGSSREAQNVLKRIEREATYRYQTLTLPHDEAVNCINVNGTILFRQEFADCFGKFQSLEDCASRPVSFNELCKLGGDLSQHCLLFRRLKLFNKA